MTGSGSLLSEVRAQETAIATVRRALAKDRVHHAYLFEGPAGVGKEKVAFGLAQALVCERRPDTVAKDDACGECSPCLRAVPRAGEARPVHPDVAVLERGLYDGAAIGRKTDETQDISIQQVRTLVLARAAFPPHEGRAKVFIVRRAEELSVSAANALLKTLEEPNRGTHFILLSAAPDLLLPTIRSRTQRVRFASLPDEVVASLLGRDGIEVERANEIAALSAGSMETALALADRDASDERTRFVTTALAALAAPDLGLGLELAEDAKKHKGDLPSRLLALAARLAADARAASQSSDRTADVAAVRYRVALEAAQQLDGNASAQLVVESMIVRMRSA